jgi:hypothetical protein
MKLATSLMVASALIVGTTLANAQGASNKAPGQEMQQKGSVRVAQAHLAKWSVHIR